MCFFSQKKPQEPRYSKEQLLKMSMDELHRIYDDMAYIVMANLDKSPSKKIPSKYSAHGCTTIGEARDFMDLVVEVQKIKIDKKNKAYEQISDAEKQKFSNIGKLNEALAAYKKANSGDADGMLCLGLMYDLDLKMPEKAFYWVEKASKKGNIQAKYILGTYYGDGKGVKENRTKGVSLIIEAASKGYKDAIDFCKNKLKMTPSDMRSCGISV